MKKSFLGVLALGLLAGPGLASAGLIGDTTGIQVVGQNGAVVTGDSGVVSRVVGAGEEGNLFGSQFYDFGDFSFSIRSNSNFCGWYTCNGADVITMTLSSLDFGAPLSSVAFETNLTGVSYLFGSDFVRFSWNNQGINTGYWLSARFTAVPEPGSLALMGLALAALAFTRKRSPR